MHAGWPSESRSLPNWGQELSCAAAQNHQDGPVGPWLRKPSVQFCTHQRLDMQFSLFFSILRLHVLSYFALLFPLLLLTNLLVRGITRGNRGGPQPRRGVIGWGSVSHCPLFVPRSRDSLIIFVPKGQHNLIESVPRLFLFYFNKLKERSLMAGGTSTFSHSFIPDYVGPRVRHTWSRTEDIGQSPVDSFKYNLLLEMG